MENNKLKICYVANDDSFVKFLLMPQIKFLIKEGYSIYAVCSDGKWISDIKKEGVTVKIIKIKRKISPFYDLITLFKLWNYFRKENFDIVHTNNPKPGLLGQLAAKIAGVPIVVNTIHGLYFYINSSNLKRKFFLFIEKIAGKCSDLIFCVGREDVDTLIEEKVVKPDKIKYFGNGVDIEKFNSEKFSKEFIDKKKKEFNIPEDYKIIGITARLLVGKGYLDLFEALKSVVKIFPKTILLVLGREEPEKKFGVKMSVVKNYGIEKNVIFLGEIDNISQIYPIMDIFTLPSHGEGLSVSILEAMAEKRAIVATNIRGSREEIENGKSGILVPAKNPEKLSEAIIYLLENKQKANEMAEGAKIRAQKEFDERLVFNRIKKEYKRLINRKIK
jgi:glycosyltransferase involved in cell wall biosynthesis